MRKRLFLKFFFCTTGKKEAATLREIVDKEGEYIIDLISDYGKYIISNYLCFNERTLNNFINIYIVISLSYVVLFILLFKG